MQRLGQLGQYWLSQRKNSPVWCRTWFDTKSRGRQTRRASLGTRDFEDARVKLAEWYIAQRAAQAALICCPTCADAFMRMIREVVQVQDIVASNLKENRFASGEARSPRLEINA